MSTPLPMADQGDMPPRMSPFYLPSKRVLEVLNTKNWICCYSGGKDSTSLVMYVEWLRRTGMVKVARPRLVLSDTGTEYDFLTAVSDRMLETMRACGWETQIVRPKRSKKLYVSIFGRGLIPPLLGTRGMRWCTAQTKVAPMKAFIASLGADVVPLSGMRWGESAGRDRKLREFGGCKSGTECGLVQLDSGGVTFKPIETWYTHEVINWLNGDPIAVPAKVTDMIPDLLAVGRDLVRVYDPTYGRKGFGLVAQKVNTLRFGCCGCPALVRDKVIKKKSVKNPQLGYINRVYVIWEEVRKQYNRLYRIVEKDGKQVRKIGPIKLAVRKKFFEQVLDIQRQSGVQFVPEKDERLVRKMWRTGECYSRSWGPADDPTWDGGKT